MEAVHVPTVLDCLDSSAWHQQAACRDEGINFVCSDYELDRRFPGSPTLVLPLLICTRCPVRRACLAEALSAWQVDHTTDSIIAVGIWGATTTIERRAVADLPIPEAIDRLEAELPERVAGHVRAFYDEGYHSSRNSGRPRVRRILRILTTEAARVAANGSRKAQEPVPRFRAAPS